MKEYDRYLNLLYVREVNFGKTKIHHHSKGKFGDSDVGDFFSYVGDFLNVLNRSPTSQTCHQHIWSLTSVTNIDVTVKINISPEDSSLSFKNITLDRPLSRFSLFGLHVSLHDRSH